MTSENSIDILLVDDNATDVELTSYAFKKLSLLPSIKIVRDGAEALEFLLGNKSDAQPDNPRAAPKVILLDLKLPKINGVQVLRELKSNVRTRNIPVVVFTSSDEERDVREAYDLGANSYVVKPVDFNQFSETINHVSRYWLSLNQRSNFSGK